VLQESKLIQNIFVYGEITETYVVAVVIPNFEILKHVKTTLLLTI
jgi:long-subunit acyl-CoA synthetase (AMP-forming)